MALINPGGLYTGGAVRLDSNPSLNVYAQLLAKKQAKDDAIDEYYRKLPGTLNAAGMRDQDRAGFDQAVGNVQKYWMENKEKIRKGNTPEAFQYEKMFRDVGAGVDQSKQAAKTDLELGKMRFSKENEYIFEDPDFANAQHAHSIPIWDKEHKSMDLGTIAVPPRPFDADAQGKLWTNITKGNTPGKKYDYEKSYTNPQTGQVIVPFKKEFSPEQIQKIADAAAEAVKNDRSARAFYNKILNNPNGETIIELQKAYSKYYKGIVDTPEKVAAADAIVKASTPQEVGEEQESNYGQKQADVVHKIYLTDSLIRGRKSSGGSEDLTDYDVFGKYKDKTKKVIQKVKTGGTWLSPIYEDKEVEVIPANEVTANDKKLILGVEPQTLPDGTKGYVVRPDGDWEGKKGQVISRTDAAKKNMDETSLNEVKRGRLNPNLTPKTSGGSKKVTMVMPDGTTGEIDEDKVAAFLKKYPKAKRK